MDFRITAEISLHAKTLIFPIQHPKERNAGTGAFLISINVSQKLCMPGKGSHILHNFAYRSFVECTFHFLIKNC